MGNYYGGYYYSQPTYCGCQSTYYSQPTYSSYSVPSRTFASKSSVSNLRIMQPGANDRKNFNRVITFDVPSGQIPRITRSGIDVKGRRFFGANDTFSSSNTTSSNGSDNYIKKTRVRVNGRLVDRYQIFDRAGTSMRYDIAGNIVEAGSGSRSTSTTRRVVQPGDGSLPAGRRSGNNTTINNNSGNTNVSKRRRQSGLVIDQSTNVDNSVTNRGNNSNFGTQDNRFKIKNNKGIIIFSVNGDTNVGPEAAKAIREFTKKMEEIEARKAAKRARRERRRRRREAAPLPPPATSSLSTGSYSSRLAKITAPPASLSTKVASSTRSSSNQSYLSRLSQLA